MEMSSSPFSWQPSLKNMILWIKIGFLQSIAEKDRLKKVRETKPFIENILTKSQVDPKCIPKVPDLQIKPH